MRVDEPDLVKQLGDKGVKFTGRTQGSFLGGILSWILPIGIMFVLWNLFMSCPEVQQGLTKLGFSFK